MLKSLCALASNGHRTTNVDYRLWYDERDDDLATRRFLSGQWDKWPKNKTVPIKSERTVSLCIIDARNHKHNHLLFIINCYVYFTSESKPKPYFFIVFRSVDKFLYDEL